MKLPIKNLNSPLGARLSIEDEKSVLKPKEVNMMADAVIDNVLLSYRSPYDKQHPNKPYLHIKGHISHLFGRLSYGVTSLEYDKSDAPTIDAFYEFNNDQLKHLVDLGLYEPNFRLNHDDLIGQALNMPVTCNFCILKPHKDKGQQYPIVFGDIQDLHLIQLTYQNSGYDLSQYFVNAYEDQKEQAAKEQSNTKIKDEVKEGPDYISLDSMDDAISAPESKQSEDTNYQQAPEMESLDDLSNNMIFDEDDVDSDQNEADDDKAVDDEPEADDSEVEDNSTESNENKAGRDIVNKALAKIRQRQEAIARQNDANNNDNESENESALIDEDQESRNSESGKKKLQKHKSLSEDTTSAEHLQEVRTNEITNNADDFADSWNEDSGDLADESDINDANDVNQKDLAKEKHHNRSKRHGRRHHFSRNKPLSSLKDLNNDGIDDDEERSTNLKPVADAPVDDSKLDKDDYISY